MDEPLMSLIISPGISVQTSPTGPMVQQAGLKISFDLIKRVQVVYVLGLFLVGKHRKKVGRNNLNILNGSICFKESLVSPFRFK